MYPLTDWRDILVFKLKLKILLIFSYWILYLDISIIMDQADIKEILSLLKSSYKTEDWELVDEAISYLEEYLDDSDYDDDEE